MLDLQEVDAVVHVATYAAERDDEARQAFARLIAPRELSGEAQACGPSIRAVVVVVRSPAHGLALVPGPPVGLDQTLLRHCVATFHGGPNARRRLESSATMDPGPCQRRLQAHFRSEARRRPFGRVKSGASA